ncbi:MAG TPA: hypothetical protein VJN29_03060 [Intrasporangium sp.]|uniref:hypothetical protein n=1 Tax=Intrasporangium sp. TaxID=1925024 RepID=UPI002B488D0C|nr:hypothetical protein [Intrasporangium sp.]HKX66180.1 hypothetical protein [Intrasporangium sp.]
MTTSQELIARVRAAAEGTPHVVDERPYGFDLTIDVVDARWWTLLRKNSVERAFTHEVHLDEPRRRMTITDISNEVRWDAEYRSAGRKGWAASRRSVWPRPSSRSPSSSPSVSSRASSCW